MHNTWGSAFSTLQIAVRPKVAVLLQALVEFKSSIHWELVLQLDLLNRRCELDRHVVLAILGGARSIMGLHVGHVTH